MTGTKIKTLVVALVVAASASAPAYGVPHEHGGAAPSGAAPQVRAEGFDWGDAGVGIAIGAGAGVLAAATALGMRRQRVAPQDAATPAAR